MVAKRGNGKDRSHTKDLMQFPCRYEIKVMGQHSMRFEALVQAIISRYIGSDDLLATKHRPSRHGKYLSLTCIIRARSRTQLDIIYTALKDCPEVLMTL